MTAINTCKILFIAVTLILAIICPLSAQGPKRNRGEGIYQLPSSNTSGLQNIWVTLRGTGFLWANKSLDSTEQKPGIFPFGELYSEIGVTQWASLLFESRVFSYTRNGWFQFGNVVAGTKLTLPNNKELRFWGIGLESKYIWNNTNDTFPSLAGYRAGTTGFAPEGYIVSGSNIQIKMINDFDLISLYSWLPVKAGVSLGIRIPLQKAEYVFNQYLFDIGVSYFGPGYDFFVMYSLEALNNLTSPLLVTNLPQGRRTQIAFSENPMYLTIGGKVRYDNGIALSLFIPFLMSQNYGSSMTRDDLRALNESTSPGSKFYDEHQKGLTDPFDPWYAKWKIVGEISFPILYKQTGSEMMRNFLLMKNQDKSRKIDIDEQLRAGAIRDSIEASAQDSKQRIEDIKKRREELQKP